jgi:protein tyrosine phosphatase
MYQVKLSYNHQPGSDYINASFINGYKQKDAYIATQGPLQNTVDDFWRMMWEYQCGNIVMLCQLEEDGEESSYCYWPGEVGDVMECGRLRVRLGQVNSHDDMVVRKLEVTIIEGTTYQPKPPNTLIVTMLQLLSWPQHGLPNPMSILSLIEQLTIAQMRSSSLQTVVMCSDGVVRAGTFICIHSQLERLKTEGVVDVFQAIKSACIQRPGIIPNVAHYVFCYEVLSRFVEKMENYANFKTVI